MTTFLNKFFTVNFSYISLTKFQKTLKAEKQKHKKDKDLL